MVRVITICYSTNYLIHVWSGLYPVHRSGLTRAKWWSTGHFGLSARPVRRNRFEIIRILVAKLFHFKAPLTSYYCQWLMFRSFSQGLQKKLFCIYMTHQIWVILNIKASKQFLKFGVIVHVLFFVPEVLGRPLERRGRGLSRFGLAKPWHRLFSINYRLFLTQQQRNFKII